MATNIPPFDPTSVPDATSDGLSATTITQIILGVVIAFVPVVICCICSSTWMTSKLRRRPREEDVVEETSLDDMVQAMFVRRQRGGVNVPTYKEVRLEELDAEGRWMKVQPLAAAFRVVISKDSRKSVVPPHHAPGTPGTLPLLLPLSPSAPCPLPHFRHEPNSPTPTPSFLDISIVVRMPRLHSQWPALKDHRPSPNLHTDDLVIATRSSPLITTDMEVL